MSLHPDDPGGPAAAAAASSAAATGAGLPRNVYVAGLVSFFTDISSEMIVPVLPLFLVGTLQAPVTAVGVIEGIAESTASILRVFAGWFSDRTGRRKALMLSGYALSNFTKPLLALATAWPQVLLIRFSDRFGKGVRGAPRDALIADSVDPSIRGRAFGLHRAMDTAGAAIGPLLAAAVLALTANEPRAVFWLAALPGIAAVLVGWRFLRERPTPPRAASAPKLGFAHLGMPFALFTGISTLFALGNSSDAFLILRAQDAGMPAAVIPLAYFGFNMLAAALATPAGMLSDRAGRRPLLAAGYAVFAAVYAGFALAANAVTVGLLLLLYSCYSALTDGVARALIADLVPAELRATAMGTYSTATGLALLPASVLAGALWDSAGPWAPFAYGAVMAAVAALLLAVVPLRARLCCHTRIRKDGIVEFVMVGAGAFIGANLRYLVASWVVQRSDGTFPLATLIINVTGSFVIGLFLAGLGERAASATYLRLFFATGLLGGYTTFSTFSFEALALLQQENWAGAAVYTGGSVALGLAAAILGVMLGRMLNW